MCGIFGWSIKRKSRLPPGKREVLAGVLSVANSLRGDASWGVYTHSRQGGNITKKVGSVAEVSGFAALGRLPIVMAHTRQPTMGKVIEKNAHPFEEGNIILSHNGMIYNSSELDKKYSRSVRVDSQHLAMHLAEGKEFSDIEGYGAIEWVNKDHPDRIYLSRLKGGSLSIYGILVGRERVGVAWSSDKEHLRSALGAARLDCEPFEELKDGEVNYTENGVLYECKGMNLALSTAARVYQTAFGDERGYWKFSEGKWMWVSVIDHFQSFRGGHYYGGEYGID